MSGVKVSAGSVWMGRHCILRVLSLVRPENMPGGSVLKRFDSTLHPLPCVNVPSQLRVGG